jgi:hypothetical protein
MSPHLAIALLAIAATAAPLVAQRRVHVSDIKANPNEYLNERVEVEGTVAYHIDDRAGSTTRFYVLKDDFYGATIYIRTVEEFPEANKRFKVQGTVTYDTKRRDIFIHEDRRFALEAPAPPQIVEPVGAASPGATPAATMTTVTPPTPWWSNTSLLILVIFLGLLLLFIIIALVVTLTSKRRRSAPTGSYPTIVPQLPLPGPAYGPSPSAAPMAPPQEVIEGHTIKMHAPPPNTVKLMPGWLEVLSGDDVVKQIRFYRLRGEAMAETTFGRAPGKPYSHIQLKPMTVSSKQAKISFEPSGPRLTNFAPADSNPTRVNGRDLVMGESVALSEGDSVEMGEVHFRYHAG